MIHCRRARDGASWKAVLDRTRLGLALGVSAGISLEALCLERPPVYLIPVGLYWTLRGGDRVIGIVIVAVGTQSREAISTDIRIEARCRIRAKQRRREFYGRDVLKMNQNSR